MSPLKRAESKKLAWAPSAITYPSDGGLGIYIRYGNFPNKITLLEEGYGSMGHIRVQCPDRELLIVNNAHVAWGERPMMGNYDEYIHLGMYHDHINEDMNLPYYMMNYFAESTKRHNAESRKTLGEERDPNTLIMCDSGGFQIARGRVEYMDAKNLVEWYNDNVDIGFALDVPVNSYEPDLLLRSAKIHASNNQRMLDHKKPGLELMNILQGASLEKLKMYREVVEHPDIDRMAIAGLYHWFNLLGSIDSLVYLANNGQKYKNFHILGVSNSLHIALLTRLASKGVVPMLTTDSSTAVQKARLREWHTYIGPHERVRFVPVGYKNGYRANVNNLLPCSCQVCSAIKYADVLWCIGGNIATKIFEMHNVHSMNRYFDSLADHCEELSTKELKQLLRRQIGENRQGFDEAMQCLDFIDNIATKGYDAAHKKYSYYLDDSTLFANVTSHEPQSLLGGEELKDEEGNVICDGDDERDVDLEYDHANRVLSAYESAMNSGTAKHGKKVKKGENESAIVAVSKKASGGVKKPMTKSDLKRKAKS